jgi:hypothetical protein
MGDRHMVANEVVGDDKVVAFNGHQLEGPRPYNRVCPTRLTARSGKIWWIMGAPAKIGAGLVNREASANRFA